MKILNFKQHLLDGSPNPDWVNARAGRMTGSDFHQYLGIAGKGLSQTAETSLKKKALEVFDYNFAIPTTFAMQRGIDLEPQAREEYCLLTGAKVEQVGFCDYESLNAGCSPDGVIYDEQGNIEKIIEIKCPLVEMFIENLFGYIKPEYKTQMQFNMFITGAKSCDFIAYHPDFKLIVQTIERDEEAIEKIKQSLELLEPKFVELVNKIGESKL